jgi:hypothetical protein
MATDRMPPPVPHVGEPTLAAFRAHLAEQVDARGTFAVDLIGGAVIRLIDRYAAEVAGTNRPDSPGGIVVLEGGPLDLRLQNAGRVRRLADSLDLPALIREAVAAGKEVPAVAHTLSVGESYAYRIVREAGGVAVLRAAAQQ